MRITAISNFKGGVGKTVTAVNLAAILADRGKRVLLIDADPQHNATGFYLTDEPGTTLTDVLQGCAEACWPDVVTPTGREGLDLIGADMGLLTLDLAAITQGGSEYIRRLRELLWAMDEDDGYDAVLIDCPPSFTAASVAALKVATDVIIPTTVGNFDRNGVAELMTQIRSLDRHLHPRVLITMTDRTNLCRQGAALLRESGLDVYRTEIRRCTAVGESTYVREPLIDYKPKSTAACDYAGLAAEYLGEG